MPSYSELKRQAIRQRRQEQREYQAWLKEEERIDREVEEQMRLTQQKYRHLSNSQSQEKPDLEKVLAALSEPNISEEQFLRRLTIYLQDLTMHETVISREVFDLPLIEAEMVLGINPYKIDGHYVHRNLILSSCCW